MKVNSSIFKAYDIRGVYAKDWEAKSAFRIGQAFAAYLHKQNGKKKLTNGLNVVVARDNRLSSPKLSNAVISGLTSAGANVIDIGIATTPMMYFAVAFYKNAGGLMITASHNPKEYNGIKMVKEQAIPISTLEEGGIKMMVMSGDDFASDKKGKVKQKNVIKDYVDFTVKGFDVKKIYPFKIAVDTANAVPGVIVRPMMRQTKCKVRYFLEKLDGEFPVHTPNPLEPAAKQYLEERMREDRYDLGIAFDGDGDRILFLDENGNDIRPDIITALVAEIISRKRKGQKFYYDLRSSNAIPEAIKSAGGVPVMGRIGHTFIKQLMRKENIKFGGECSGHYYFKDSFFFESPFFVLFTILQFMSESRLPLSNAIAKYFTHSYSGELNFKVPNAPDVIELAQKKYHDGKITTIDGIRIDYEDWWFSLRASNTEPLLRLVVEAQSGEILEEKINELKEIIEGEVNHEKDKEKGKEK